MSRILVITPIYPASDIPKGWTPVVHYFALEWVKQGHEVHVINYVANLPNPVYWVASLFEKRLTSKFGFTVRATTLKDAEYQLDGVNVCRIMLSKTRPHHRYPTKQIMAAKQKTLDYLRRKDFVPDAIVSHWGNPSVELMYFLKKEYKVPTCYVAHDAGHFNEYGEDASRYWQAIDVIGYRSASIKRRFETSQEFIKPSFMCYSGIPASTNENTVERSFEQVKTVAYVGTLIKRKYPSQILSVLKENLGNDFTICYAGVGQEATTIQSEVQRLDINKNVKLLGRISRDDVFKLLDESDLFIMISRNEAFGLVYLEAMARGCITIASRDEGFDGIIEDGYNGFLCKAGDSTELSGIINRILTMSAEQRKQISDNAMKTAKVLTDENVAKDYLKHVFGKVE